MGTSYCKEHNCPWLNTFSDTCTSPNDPHGGECDYDWASICPECEKIIAIGDDDDGCCPYCGAPLPEQDTAGHGRREPCSQEGRPEAKGKDPEEKAIPSNELLRKQEWIPGYTGRWYRKKFFCPSCGIRIRVETWDEKRCFGISTILSDNTMPNFCPNCGKAIPKTECQ